MNFALFSENATARIPWHDTIIYEAHVKGLAMRHLCRLGVTAVELLPAHQFVADRQEQLDEALLEFTRQLIRFRKDHPVFRRRQWSQGRLGASTAQVVSTPRAPR
jgi:pullulanase/glycogen debranching enzyme